VHLVAESHFSNEKQKITVAVSIGASLIRFEDDMESIIQRADQNLYKSKQTGRNKVTVDGKGAK
jgi:diguanylate cyclase (GGDEF)-like protein